MEPGPSTCRAGAPPKELCLLSQVHQVRALLHSAPSIDSGLAVVLWRATPLLLDLM